MDTDYAAETANLTEGSQLAAGCNIDSGTSQCTATVSTQPSPIVEKRFCFFSKSSEKLAANFSEDKKTQLLEAENATVNQHKHRIIDRPAGDA